MKKQKQSNELYPLLATVNFCTIPNDELMKTQFARLKRYGVVGQILWERNGLYKITFNKSTNVMTEIFTEEEFDFVETYNG